MHLPLKLIVTPTSDYDLVDGLLLVVAMMRHGGPLRLPVVSQTLKRITMRSSTARCVGSLLTDEAMY